MIFDFKAILRVAGLDESLVDGLDQKDCSFMETIDPKAKVLDDECLRGYMIAKQMAADVGCTLGMFENVCDVPIDLKEQGSKLIFKEDRATPQRRNPPLFEDVRLATSLFERDNILSEIYHAEAVAAQSGKQFCHLTTDDVPCDHYYPNFMQERSQPRGDTREALMTKFADKFEAPQGCEVVTTIWAENSKAFGRYYDAGFKKIIVLFPSDFPQSNYTRFKGYAQEKRPGLEIVCKDVASSCELFGMTSDEFIQIYNLDSSSFFLINFLPQFMHLRYGFSGFSCIYSDDSVLQNSEIGIVPDSFLSISALLDYYAIWFHENRPEMVKTGHGGIVDPIKRVRISYSQHGCFLDHWRSSSDFGEGAFIDQLLATYAGVVSESRLRLVKSDNIDGLLDYSQVGNLELYESSEAVDLSWVSLPEGTIYFPSVNLIVMKSTLEGTVKHKDVVYGGFPHDRDIYGCEIEGAYYVMDVSFARKDFFARRSFIPERLRLPYSHQQIWDHAYVIFPSSAAKTGDYKTSLVTQREYLGQDSELRFLEVIIPGLAWNVERKAIVYDENSYMYSGLFDFTYEPGGRRRYYEFDTQYAVRKSKNFRILDRSFELPASRSVQRVPPEVFQGMIVAAFHEKYLAGLIVEFISSYATYLDEADFQGFVSMDSDDGLDFEFKSSVSVSDYLMGSFPSQEIYIMWEGRYIQLGAEYSLSCSVSNNFIVTDDSGEYVVEVIYYDSL